MHAHSCDFITFINERESIVREPAVSVFFSFYLLPCTICWGKKPQANGIYINLMVSIFHLFSLLCCRFLLLSFVCVPALNGCFRVCKQTPSVCDWWHRVLLTRGKVLCVSLYITHCMHILSLYGHDRNRFYSLKREARFALDIKFEFFFTIYSYCASFVSSLNSNSRDSFLSMEKSLAEWQKWEDFLN